MSLTKALRWLSPLLVAATFLPFFATNSPNLGMDFFLYNSAPLLTLFLTFKSLNQDEKVAKVALRLALLSWIAGSIRPLGRGSRGLSERSAHGRRRFRGAG